MDFAVPPVHRVKLKDYEKRDTYLDVAREFKNLWNMKLTVIPIVIGTGIGELENKRIGGDRPNYSIVEIDLNTKKGSLKFEEICWHSKFSGKSSANVGVKNFQKIIIIIMIKTNDNYFENKSSFVLSKEHIPICYRCSHSDIKKKYF